MRVAAEVCEIVNTALDAIDLIGEPLFRPFLGVFDHTAVLIDEHVGFHRDLVALGSTQLDTAEAFYPKLRLLLDRIERELNLEVVIAGNPRGGGA